MSDPLRERIAANLRSMSDEELLEIWVANDRTSWSDTAFEVVESVVTERGIELPEQNPPVLETEADEEEAEEDEEPEAEPVFYRPNEVFSLARTIGWLAPAAVVITLLVGIPTIAGLVESARSYFLTSPAGTFLATLIALPLGILLVAVQCALIYFGLKALAAVLRILMEMEFNSRGASAEVVEDSVASVAADA